MRTTLPFLNLGFARRLPVLLQSEVTECGLACVGMMSGYFGQHFDMLELRRDFSISLKGVALQDLMQIGSRLKMEGRAVKLDLADLGKLRMPCILHWDMTHFVVLKQVTRKTIVIHDPAVGVRRLPMAEVSKSFTGVALEVWPSPGFAPRAAPRSISLRSLMGHVTGLFQSMGQILVLALALEIFAIMSPLFMQWVVDDVIVSGDRDLLTTLAIGFGLLMLMQQALNGARSWALIYMGTTLNIQWQTNVFAHLLRLPAEYFEKRHLGDVVSRFGSVTAIQQTLTTAFFSAVLDGLMTVVTLGMMFLYSRGLACISLVAMALYAAGRAAWYRPFRHATETEILHAAKQQSHFLESMRGIKAIKLFERQDQRLAGWLSLLVQQINAGLRSQKMQLLYQQMNGLLFGVANIVTVWLGASMAMDGEFTVGVLITFIAYKGQFETRVGNLIDRFFELKMLQVQGERLADIVLTPPEPSALSTADATQTPASIDLALSGLCYRYAPQEPAILDGVDLVIAQGESVAIVGPSGCGKSTLVNVMLGVLPPTEGRVLVGGRDIAQFGLQRYRSLIGTVMQDDTLFAGSIAENISFFDPHADAAWIMECACVAQVHDDIAAMPMGYRTLTGDMGTSLSGGQKQRVLLARALYKRPRLLFLDEATSHLDVERERAVNDAIRALNLTRIIVAHRPETIASADRVIVLGGGRIVMDAPTDVMFANRHTAPHVDDLARS